MKTLTRLASAVFLLAAALTSSMAAGGPVDEVRRTYLDFVASQNARDPDQIRRFLSDRPDLLWVSDGMGVWGADEILARMGSFQKAEIWRVEPDLAALRVVMLDAEAALLHLSLTLVIGAAAEPDRLDFLVSLVFTKSGGEWRIRALLTTRSKP